MGYGLKVFNKDSIVQIDQDYMNYQFFQSGLISSLTRITTAYYASNNSQSNFGRQYRYEGSVTLPAGATNPCIAHSIGTTCAITSYSSKLEGNTYSFSFMAGENVSGMKYYIFTLGLPVLNSGFGLRVFNANSQCVFDSNRRYLNVHGMAKFYDGISSGIFGINNKPAINITLNASREYAILSGAMWRDFVDESELEEEGNKVITLAQYYRNSTQLLGNYCQFITGGIIANVITPEQNFLTVIDVTGY